MFDNFRKNILPPLIVMWLLTALVGMTAYEQGLRWQTGVREAIENVSAILIRSNIRNELRVVQQNLDQDPEKTRSSWQAIRKQSLMLQRMKQQAGEAAEPGFELFVQVIEQTDLPKRELVDTLLASPYLQSSLNGLDELKALQASTQQVILMVVFSMLALGLLLTLVTARDLDRLFQQLARSRDLNIQIQEQERHRIAQELHDGVVQELIDLKRDYRPEKVEQILQNLRRVCYNLKPQVLDDLGLAAAIEFLADDLNRQAGVQVELHLDQDGLAQLPKSYELPIFRVVQELCSNIKHHAQAKEARVRILYNPQESPLLRGYVSDNGCGFDPQTVPPGKMGLTGMQERIHQLDGQFRIESAPGQGSRFYWTVPIRQDAA
ncbi:MAG TPA: sensor histidine kinase [Oculatellaceae cyanobacterium]|jgi:signal transduction histidine kinase